MTNKHDYAVPNYRQIIFMWPRNSYLLLSYIVSWDMSDETCHSTNSKQVLSFSFLKNRSGQSQQCCIFEEKIFCLYFGVYEVSTIQPNMCATSTCVLGLWNSEYTDPAGQSKHPHGPMI